MYSIGYFVLDTAMVISTMWIVDRFWRSFFEKRKSIFSIIVWLCFMLWQFIFTWEDKDIHINASVVNIVFLLLIATFCYQGKGKVKYFLVAVFYSVWELVELLVFYLISGMAMGQGQADIIGSVVSKIITIIFIHIFSILRKEKNHDCIPAQSYFFLLLIPAGSIYIALIEFYFIGNIFFSLITVSILLIFNVVIFEMYEKLNEAFINDTEKTVHVQQLEVISKNTEEQKKMMEEFHEEKHNLTNELIVLKNGIEMSNMETAVKTLNKIIRNSNMVENICSSGNSTVDAIINFKYAVAQECRIRFQLKVFIPEVMPIDQCDLGVVLGNAIDNAIEATKECNRNEKVIEIILGVKKEALIIIVKNPYEHPINLDRNGNILSTKKEKKRHGFGLNSINRIAEEYDGALIVDFGHNRFSLTATMNFGCI